MQLNTNNLTTNEDGSKNFETDKVNQQGSALNTESRTSQQVKVLSKLLEKFKINEQKSELETSEAEVKSRTSRTIIYKQPVLVDEWIINANYKKLAEENMEKSLNTKIPIVLVFDLNGTLVKRGGTSNRTVYLRPHIHEFIEFVMQNFHVITWTTAKPHNSYRIICKAFGPYTEYILCNLTRLHCKVFGNYFEKSPTIKDLEVIWNTEFKVDSELVMKTLPSPPTLPEHSKILNEEISLLDDQRIRDLYLGKHTDSQIIQKPKILKFNKASTILLDDSPGKGEAQPLNHLVIPEYGGPSENETDDALLRLKQYLEGMVKEYKESEGKDTEFCVQDYMKNKSFKDFITKDTPTSS